MSKKKGELSERLLKWSTDEMGFRIHGQHHKKAPVKPSDLKEICRGNMAGIWEYVLEHVRSLETVHSVRGNLKLHSLKETPGYKVKYKQGSKFSAEREALLKKRKELLGKLKKTKIDVDHLEKDITRLKKDLHQSDSQYKESVEAIHQLYHKRTLMQAYLNQCRVREATYNEFQNSMKDKQQHYSSLASKSSQESLLFSKERLDSYGNREDVLETACTKKVREVCKQIQVHFLDVLQSRSTDEETLKENKSRLWEQIEETVRNNSAEDILQSLTTITNEAATHLIQKTSQINIKKDVEDLRFRYESDKGFVDLSSGKNELKSVQQIIMEKQLAHIQRFMEGEKKRGQAAKMNIELSRMVTKMEQILQERFANRPGELDLAKTLFTEEMNLVAATAALKVLKAQQQDLQEQAATSKKEKDALFAKYKQIQDFQTLTDRKQSLIQVLIKENLNSRQKLNDNRLKIERYAQTAICEHEAGITAMATSLKDTSANEIQAFSGLSLEMLQLTKLAGGELRPTNQLSIARFNTSSPALGGDAVHRIQAALHFPAYKAPEKILSHVIQMKCEIADIEGLLTMRELLQNTLSSFHAKDIDVIQHIKELCERVKAQDNKQNEQLGPVLQARLTEGAEAINFCTKTKSDLAAWWDQPAQHLTPWVKVDDLTFSQWMDKWIMGVSQLKEMTETAGT